MSASVADDRINLFDAVHARHRLAALASRLKARDDYAASYAVDNLVSGKPAYWSAAGYHSANHSLFRQYINVEGGILLGIGALAYDFPHSLTDYAAAGFIDELLPLNEAAVGDLIAAYLRIGSFCEPDELIRRTARAEGSYLPTLRSAAGSRSP